MTLSPQHPISLSRHLPIFILMKMANFFMDDTKSQYPKPDPKVLAKVTPVAHRNKAVFGPSKRKGAPFRWPPAEGRSK
jgi:hypothetical protein